MIRVFFVVSLAFLIGAFILGCGGGGGGSGGTGSDPIEVEINAFLDVFLAAINREDIDGAMQSVDTNLKYYCPANPNGAGGYPVLRSRLQAFFADASSISVSLIDRGVSPSSETLVHVRSDLVYSYYDASGTMHSFPPQKCEMAIVQSTRWGIVSLSGSQDTNPLSFPP